MSNVLPIITPENFDIDAYMQDSEPRAKVLSPTAWHDALVQSTRNDGANELQGACLPWSKTHDNLRFRGGEVSIWQGMNGHGKSQLLGQVMMGFSAQNEPTCIASFEMKPLQSLKRMLRQASMTDSPSEQFASRFVSWLDKRMWFYDQMGSVRPEMVYAVIRYAVEKLKVKHFMVDSLMKCVQGEDDFNGQKAFVDKLTSLARDYDAHIHLVHHVRKSENEDRPPGKYDAKGSGAITDLVDNFFTVWRNKPKERAVESELRKNHVVSPETANKPDSVVICDKQRHGEWEGRFGLWFNRPSLQYTGDSSGRPLEMVGALL